METRNQKILRELNERIDRKRTVFREMTVAEKQVVAVAVLIVAIVAIVIGLAL